jgi:hypothetical protein
MRIFVHPGKASMGTVIIAIGIAGFVLLFVATVALVTLNWSEKTLAPVLSILLVGTATTLATVLVTLKGSTVESAFPTSVVFDTNQGAPLFVIPSQTNPKLTSRLSELARLGRPMVNRDGKAVSKIEKPASTGDMFTFGGELLQYQLVSTIETLQRGGWKAGMFFGASGATISNPMKLSNARDYSKAALLLAVANNRFSQSDMERFRWEHSRFPLPKNTTLTLVHLVSSASTGTEKYIVRLEKPMFFQINFVIEPLIGTGPGILPKGLDVDPQLAASCETYQFRITTQARFEKITAGNSQTQEYKDWAAWLFAGVKDNVGD